MISFRQYYHVNALQLAIEVHYLLSIDGQQRPDVYKIYDSIEYLCNKYHLKADGYNIAYANYDILLRISNNNDFDTDKWLCKYIVKAIMRNSPTAFGMTDEFCIEF